MELEAVLNGNTFLLYFMGLLYILINKDFDKNQKIVMIYVFVYSLKLFNIVDLKILLIGLGIVSFLYIEFLSDDNVKNVLLCNIIYKIIDYMYKLIFEYSAAYFCIALFLMSSIIRINLPIIQILDLDIHVIDVKINIISILLVIYAINNITSQKFETYSFKYIKEKMDEITVWNTIKRSNIDALKLNMLIDVEDKSYFIRKNTYNFFSFEFFNYKIKKLINKLKYIKNDNNSLKKKKLSNINIKIKNMKKYIRGYSTIEMQIIRTLGIKNGYEDHIFCRKIFEIIYSKIFFSSLRKYMNKIYLDTSCCCTFKEYLLMIYIKIAPIKLNNIKYNNMCKPWNNDDITKISDEQFFISILGLSYRWISSNILFNYSRTISKYSLKKGEIRKIIKNLNKE